MYTSWVGVRIVGVIWLPSALNKVNAGASVEVVGSRSVALT